MSSRKIRRELTVNVGDFVLIGPIDLIEYPNVISRIGRVLWTDGKDILLEDAEYPLLRVAFQVRRVIGKSSDAGSLKKLVAAIEDKAMEFEKPLLDAHSAVGDVNGQKRRALADLIQESP